ncbi:polymer-forming cytoskeletal protein [Malonomonas rubra]|uniref:bactofilin family protein n=1 Tax=Malonomonas rubra TaxID=57040 RepID=UPI0026F0BF76|nr:polymer-forming cytoskeletal protein [Malonomonas rubra]
MRKETPLEKGEIKAFLGPGSKFEGKLFFDEIVRLDGNFKGEITSKDTLIVGETADIEGEVAVGSFILSGRFKGNVKAATRVELRRPAQIEGTIEAPILSIEEGVVLNGSVSMTGASAKKTTP